MFHFYPEKALLQAAGGYMHERQNGDSGCVLSDSKCYNYDSECYNKWIFDTTRG